MKRFFFFFFVGMTCSFLLAQPQQTATTGENRLQLADSVVRIGAGEQYLYVEMLNPNLPATAFQFDLRLPEGMTFVNATLPVEDGRMADHVVVTGTPSDGVQRFVVYSPTNTPCAETSGTVLRVAVALSSDIIPGNYPVQMSRMELAAPDNYVRSSEPQTMEVVVSNTTAIRDVASDVIAAEAYDLSGRRAHRARRGLCIVGGKKLLVK